MYSLRKAFHTTHRQSWDCAYRTENLTEKTTLYDYFGGRIQLFCVTFAKQLAENLRLTFEETLG